MGYWGWRPLVCGLFVSSWVVGCTIVTSTSSPNETPTAYPQVTLTVGRLAGATVPPLFWSHRAITVTPDSNSSPNSAVIVEPPMCYPQNNGELLCLGQVINRSSEAVSGVIIEVILGGRSGDQRRLVTIEQRLIPAGGRAPFAAIFALDGEDAQGQDVVFARLEAALLTTPLDVIVLEAEAVQGNSTSDRRYALEVVIRNPSRMIIQFERAVIMLSDANQQLIGYRVVDAIADQSVLEPYQATTMMLEVFRQRGVDQPIVRVYAEGRRIQP